MTVLSRGAGGGLMVRAAVLDDAESLCELSRQAILVSAAGHYTEPQLHAWAGRRTVAGHREMIRLTTAFVAVEADTIMGFVTPGSNAVRSTSCSPTLPTAAGASLPRCSRRSESAARAAGVDRLLTHASWRAAPVFERFGYQPDEVETVVVDGHELTRVRMHKDISGGAADDAMWL